MIAALIAKIGGKFASDFIWNVASMALVGVCGLALNAIILVKCGNEPLGVFNQAFAVQIIISQISVCGIQFSVLKHCSWQQDDIEACRRSLFVGLLMVLSLGILAAGGLMLTAEHIADLLDSAPVGVGVRCIAWGIIFFSLNKVLMMALNGLRHMKALAVFNATRFILILLFTGILIHRGEPPGMLPAALSLSELALFVLLTIYVNRRMFPIIPKLGGHLIELVKEHFSFGIRGFLSGLLIEANTRVDILMLGYFLSDGMVGIYSFAAAFAEGFAQMIFVMRRNIDPIIGQHFAEKTTAEISDLAKKIRLYFYPFMTVGGICLCAGFPVLLWLIKPDADWRPYWFVLLILVAGFVVISGYNCFIGLLIQGGRPGAFSLLMGITVGCNIILNAILIPILGIYGAAAATSTAYIIQTVFIIIAGRKFFGVRI